MKLRRIIVVEKTVLRVTARAPTVTALCERLIRQEQTVHGSWFVGVHSQRRRGKVHTLFDNVYESADGEVRVQDKVEMTRVGAQVIEGPELEVNFEVSVWVGLDMDR